jgi:hypothetical protein
MLFFFTSASSFYPGRACDLGPEPSFRPTRPTLRDDDTATEGSTDEEEMADPPQGQLSKIYEVMATNEVSTRCLSFFDFLKATFRITETRLAGTGYQC